MDDYRQRLGRFGEKIAENYLEHYGYAIVGRNFKTYYGEIDLIAQKGDEILFCEVKTRTATVYGYPEEAVDCRKVRHLLKATGAYLEQKEINIFWRLDIISVEINKAGKYAKIRWFKNVSEDFGAQRY